MELSVSEGGERREREEGEVIRRRGGSPRTERGKKERRGWKKRRPLVSFLCEVYNTNAKH